MYGRTLGCVFLCYQYFKSKLQEIINNKSKIVRLTEVRKQNLKKLKSVQNFSFVQKSNINHQKQSNL